MTFVNFGFIYRIKNKILFGMRKKNVLILTKKVASHILRTVGRQKNYLL